MIFLFQSKSTSSRRLVETSGATRPGADNTYSCGTASNRWSVVYAASGNVTTSDERKKSDIAPISDAILDAWADVQFVQFRWQEAKQQKGDAARWHFGVVAQRVKCAFEARGLDPFELGLLCYDQWAGTPERNPTDAAREAGECYGIRYEEALALEAALMRRELERLKATKLA